MTKNFDHGVIQLLNELQDELVSPFISAQLWSLDDLGFHQVFGPLMKEMQVKEIARQACLNIKSIYQDTLSVHPFPTDNNMCATILFLWDEPLSDSQNRANQTKIQLFIPRLRNLLKAQRFEKLSGSAQQADWLGKVISLALQIESCTDIKNKYLEIHQALSKLMNAKNFFVATLDKESEYISFDYYVDQCADAPDPIKVRDGILYGSLTALVIVSKRLLRAPSDDLLLKMGYEDKEDKFAFGFPAYDWLGVPICVGNQAIGAIVVQSYEENILFRDSDPGIIMLLAETLATSLHRRQVREELEGEIVRKTSQLADTNIKLESFIEQLQFSQTKLVEAEKQAALGRLIAGMAHELNTPLGICVTAITHISDVSKETHETYNSGQLTKVKFASFFDNITVASSLIQSNLRRADDLVEQFKQLGHHENPQKNAVVYIGAVLNDIRSYSQIKYPEHEIYIELDCHEDMVIRASTSTIQQLFEQLINNSIEHGFTDGGTAKISISCHQKDGCLHIQYRDNGSGMSDDVANKAFDPFFTTARNKGHAGLGLHGIFNIVTQQLKGNITLESSIDIGTLFSINIPS
jgi:signal transduction histidine kinase